MKLFRTEIDKSDIEELEALLEVIEVAKAQIGIKLKEIETKNICSKRDRLKRIITAPFSSELQKDL